MDEDDRKALQVAMCGKASLSDMSVPEITRLLDRLNRNNKAPAGHRTHIGKIRALWWCLYWLGEVESAEEPVISAFVKRQTGITALRFIDHRHAPSVIEALKAWLARVGVAWPGAEELADRQGATAQLERIAVLDAIQGKCLTAGLLGDDVWRDFADDIPMHRWAKGRSVTELDAAIRHFGQMLRDARG
jgi:hypothetical protein